MIQQVLVDAQEFINFIIKSSSSLQVLPATIQILLFLKSFKNGFCMVE